VIDRGNATAAVFRKDEDLGAFGRIMGEACIRVPMREQRRIGGVYATLSPSEIGRYGCRDVKISNGRRESQGDVHPEPFHFPRVAAFEPSPGGSGGNPACGVGPKAG